MIFVLNQTAGTRNEHTNPSVDDEKAKEKEKKQQNARVSILICFK